MRRVLLITLVWLAGCMGPTIKDRHAGTVELKFHNEAGGPVCALYVFPFGQSEQGQSWLAPDTMIASGEAASVWVKPNTYQVHVTGCPFEHQQISGYIPSIILNASGVIALYKEDDKRSKDAADGVVHAHENGALMTAKFTFVDHPSARPKPAPPPATH